MKRKSAEIYIIIGLYPNETDWKRRGTHAPHTKKGAAMTLRQALLKRRSAFCGQTVSSALFSGAFAVLHESFRDAAPPPNAAQVR